MPGGLAAKGRGLGLCGCWFKKVGFFGEGVGCSVELFVLVRRYRVCVGLRYELDEAFAQVLWPGLQRAVGNGRFYTKETAGEFHGFLVDVLVAVEISGLCGLEVS